MQLTIDLNLTSGGNECAGIIQTSFMIFGETINDTAIKPGREFSHTFHGETIRDRFGQGGSFIPGCERIPGENQFRQNNKVGVDGYHHGGRLLYIIRNPAELRIKLHKSYSHALDLKEISLSGQAENC